jgi:hypothetical protein
MHDAEKSANAATTGAKVGAHGAPKTYGAALPAGKAVSVAQIVAAPQRYEGKTLLVEGLVRKACTKKGCWMELAASMDPAQQGCRVTFKDYGFFVPKDSMGAAAKLQGMISIKSVSKEDVTHLEAEGASFMKKLPDGSAQELQIIATGVELSKG